MGETIPPIRPSFNRSIHIEGRPERLSAETGVLLLREADERLGLTRDLAAKIEDPRGTCVHTLPELVRTAIMLPAARLARPGRRRLSAPRRGSQGRRLRRPQRDAAR